MGEENGRVDRLVREFYELKGSMENRMANAEKDINGIGRLVHWKVFLRAAGIGFVGGGTAKMFLELLEAFLK